MMETLRLSGLMDASKPCGEGFDKLSPHGLGHGLKAKPIEPLTTGLKTMDLEKSVSQVIEAYKKAVSGKDAEALMRLYDPKVRVFDAWGVWSYEGSAAWQRAVQAWFTSLGAERALVTFEDTQVMVHGEFALVSTIATYAASSAQGEPLRSLQNRLTWGMRLKGHQLRIVHEHTSAPMGFEDMKAILQRNVAS